MTHSRFELGFPRHRKVFRLSDAAFRLWASAIDYCREQRTDGYIDRDDIAAIPRGTAGMWKPDVVKELVRAGLWLETDDGFEIHDFLDWQDSAVQVNQKRADARERMRAVRANKKRTTDARSGEVRSTDHPSLSSSSAVKEGGAGGNPPMLPRSSGQRRRPTEFDGAPKVPVRDWAGPDPLFHPKKAKEFECNMVVEEAKFRTHYEGTGELCAQAEWGRVFTNWMSRWKEFEKKSGGDSRFGSVPIQPLPDYDDEKHRFTGAP